MARSTSKRRSELSAAVIAIVGLILSLLLVTGLVVVLGQVHGEEFNPQTFARRKFVYYQLPGAGVQVTPVARTNATTALAKSISKDFLSTQSTSSSEPISSRWDMVRRSPVAGSTQTGSANVLCAYIDAYGGDTSYWTTWNDEHPELAKILWPTVQQAAVHHVYFVVPDIIEMAVAAAGDKTATAELANDLEAVLAEAKQLRRDATQ